MVIDDDTFAPTAGNPHAQGHGSASGGGDDEDPNKGKNMLEENVLENVGRGDHNPQHRSHEAEKDEMNV